MNFYFTSILIVFKWGWLLDALHSRKCHVSKLKPFDNHYAISDIIIGCQGKWCKIRFKRINVGVILNVKMIASRVE